MPIPTRGRAYRGGRSPTPNCRELNRSATPHVVSSCSSTACVPSKEVKPSDSGCRERHGTECVDLSHRGFETAGSDRRVGLGCASALEGRLGTTLESVPVEDRVKFVVELMSLARYRVGGVGIAVLVTSTD